MTNSRVRVWITFACMASAGFSFSMAGCRQHTDSPPKNSAVDPAPARVTAVRPQRKALRYSVKQPAQIEAFDQARLYAKVPAYVEKYLVDIGDKVERGQLLAELTAPELDQELEQKKALLAQANAQVEQAQAAIKVAQANYSRSQARITEATAGVDRTEAEYERWNSEYDRVVELVARQAVTKKLADETRAQMKAADAARQEATARIASAEAAMAASRAEVEKSVADEAVMRARRQVAEADEARAAAVARYLKIEAPFAGVVSERNADIGTFAQVGGANQAKPLFTVVRSDPVRVFIEVPEMDAPLVGAGDAAIVRVQSPSAREFPGTVTRTAWTLDVTTRTLHTEVDIPNPDGALRPGMYAQVTIDLAERKDAVTLPLASVVEQDAETWCFIVESGKVVRKPVRVGLKAGGEVEIESGLSGNELVVLGKGGQLKDGQPVEVDDSGVGR
jgi:HlyD family secretion protein